MGVLEEAGALSSPSGKCSLTVAVSDSNHVEYAVKSFSPGSRPFSGSSGSTYSYWAFCWDSNDRLWVWNSDIGGALISQGVD